MTGFDSIGKILLMGGLFLAVLGLLFIFAPKIPFLGRLPGDIIITSGKMQIYIPIVTSILLSVVLSVILNLVLRIFNR